MDHAAIHRAAAALGTAGRCPLLPPEIDEQSLLESLGSR
jgi:hypothetical protein